MRLRRENRIAVPSAPDPAASSRVAAADLAGRRALVTGAARNIGQGIAQRLTAAGARVIAMDRDGEALEVAFDGQDVDLLELDITAEPSVVVSAVLERFGAPELIVNNVGITTGEAFRATSEEDFDRVMHTNLRGPWFLTKGLVDALIDARSRGNIVFISSLHARRIHNSPSYSASKAAIVMLVRQLAYELAPHGIRVNSVSPGWVVPSDKQLASRDVDAIPLGRAGAAADIASMVAVLLSDDLAGYVTGVDVPVDGGLELYDWMTR